MGSGLLEDPRGQQPRQLSLATGLLRLSSGQRRVRVEPWRRRPSQVQGVPVRRRQEGAGGRRLLSPKRWDGLLAGPHRHGRGVPRGEVRRDADAPHHPPGRDPNRFGIRARAHGWRQERRAAVRRLRGAPRLQVRVCNRQGPWAQPDHLDLRRQHGHEALLHLVALALRRDHGLDHLRVQQAQVLHHRLPQPRKRRVVHRRRRDPEVRLAGPRLGARLLRRHQDGRLRRDPHVPWLVPRPGRRRGRRGPPRQEVHRRRHDALPQPEPLRGLEAPAVQVHLRGGRGRHAGRARRGAPRGRPRGRARDLAREQHPPGLVPGRGPDGPLGSRAGTRTRP